MFALLSYPNPSQKKLGSERRENNYFFVKLSKKMTMFFTDIWTDIDIYIDRFIATYQKELFLLFEKSGNF